MTTDGDQDGDDGTQGWEVTDVLALLMVGALGLQIFVSSWLNRVEFERAATTLAASQGWGLMLVDWFVGYGVIVGVELYALWRGTEARAWAARRHVCILSAYEVS